MKLAVGIRREIEREVDAAYARTGMRVGMPKVTLDAGRVRYLLRWIERAEKRIKELETKAAGL